jgi:hypothetical protein
MGIALSWAVCSANPRITEQPAQLTPPLTAAKAVGAVSKTAEKRAKSVFFIIILFNDL